MNHPTPRRLLIPVLLAFYLPAVDPAPAQETARPDFAAAWKRVTLNSQAHAPLLERQAALSPERSKHPVSLALLVLEPSLAGLVTSVAAAYDGMENPGEVEITLTEGGILDDDLLGVRHRLSLARNRNDQWRVVAYARGELRRTHLR